MSTSLINSIFNILIPPRCPACSLRKPDGAKFMCPMCSADIPLTGYCSKDTNETHDIFAGLLPIEHSCSMMLYSHGNQYSNMIHNLKYRNQWQLCFTLGEMLGREMHTGGLYSTVDLILPMPLHHRRLFDRGYNQAYYIARGVSDALHIPIDNTTVHRSRYNVSQTRVSKSKRWENVQGLFTVTHPERLEGRHILLVDDVLTTGSTIISCGNAILRSQPNCRISIATVAFAHKHK